MKHLALLSSLMILLLASCTKQELITPGELQGIAPDQALEFSSSYSPALEPDGIKSIANTNISIVYRYFIDGEELTSMDFDLNDPNLYVQLVATSNLVQGTTTLNYEFHAYTSQYEFVVWADNNNILVKDALNITNSLSMYPNNSDVSQKFDQSGQLPDFYVAFSNGVVDGVLTQSLGSYDLSSSNFTLYQESMGGETITKTGDSYMPLFNGNWDNNIVGIDGNNSDLPTVLFEDTFYKNRLNPMIYNMSGLPIVFEGPLEHLENKISSIF